MAFIKVPDSEYLMELKSLQPNTHKMVCYVVEYWDKRPPETGAQWEAVDVLYRTSQYPDIYLCGKPTGHLTSKAAAGAMKALQELFPTYSFRISRYPIPQAYADQIVVSSIWEKREATRMADGTYTPLPWAEESWFKEVRAYFKHFAHVSLDKDGMIAFTENNNKGIMDIQKRMNPGRYLQEYYNQILGTLKPFETGATNVHGEKVTISPIAYYARLFSTTYGDTCELKFATDSETMIEVYQKGPDSCMTFRHDDYAGDEHPVLVYAAGDLNLAYLVQADEEITARALVWPEKLKVGRTYGDSATLISKLQELGYQPPNGFSNIEGARMLKIPYGDGYIMPFLDACDGYYHSSDCGKFWIIGERRSGAKNYQNRAINQNGLSQEAEEEESGYICEHCNERCYEDDITTVMVPHCSRADRCSSEDWCANCSESETFFCTESRALHADVIPRIELATLYNRNIQYVTEINAGNYFQCAVNGGWYHNNDVAGIYEGDVSALVSKDASESLVRVDPELGDLGDYVSWYRPDHLPNQLTLELDEVAA